MAFLAFLDASVMIADPFFKSSTGGLVMAMVNEGTIELWSSSVAIDETITKLKSRYIELEEEANRKLGELSRLYEAYPVSERPDSLDFFDELDLFYSNQQKIQALRPLIEEYDWAVAQAVAKAPPFFLDRKEEFRDAVIWRCALRLAQERPADEVCFISANTRDFFDQERRDFHPALKDGIPKNMSIALSLLDMLSRKPTLRAIKETAEIKQWVEGQQITAETIAEAVSRYAWNQLGSQLEKKFSGMPAAILKPQWDGFVNVRFTKDDFTMDHIENVEYLPTFAVFTTIFNLSLEGSVFLPDTSARKYTAQAMVYLVALVRVKFSYDRDRLFRPIDVDVLNVEEDESSASS